MLFGLMATRMNKRFTSILHGLVFTLHYIKTLYSDILSKSNFKDHYGDATKGQCLGMTAEINCICFDYWKTHRHA